MYAKPIPFQKVEEGIGVIWGGGYGNWHIIKCRKDGCNKKYTVG